MSVFTRGQLGVDLSRTRLSRQAAAAIEGLMASRGVSHEQLAKRLEVPHGRLLHLLSGETDLTVQTLVVLAQALGTGLEIRFVDPPADSGSAAVALPEREQREAGRGTERSQQETDYPTAAMVRHVPSFGG